MSEEVELPQELIDVILGHLYADRDTHSLATCALAHRTLYRTSQVLLYRDVYFNGSQIISLFHRALRDNPHLGLYVRILRLDGPSGVQPQGFWEEDVLAAILDGVRCLEELHIDAFVPRNARVGKKMHAALLRAVARPSLRILGLTRMRTFPLATCTYTPNLRDLRLGHLLLLNWEVQRTLQPIGLTHLALALNVSDLLRFFKDGRCWLTDGRLRSLHLNTRPISPPYFYNPWSSQEAAIGIISQCAASLQSLELGCHVDIRPVFPHLRERMTRLPQLRLFALRDVHELLAVTADGSSVLSSLLVDIFAVAPSVTRITIQADLQSRSVTLPSILAQIVDVLEAEHAPHTLKSVKLLNSGDDSIGQKVPSFVKDLSMKGVNIKVQPYIPPRKSEILPPMLPLHLLDEADDEPVDVLH
ncbi:hypothetical protein EV122DRAFT_280195 [Schizophyllum commune]